MENNLWIPCSWHISFRAGLSNCFPLSVTTKCGTPNQQIMFLYMKLMNFALVIVESSSAYLFGEIIDRHNGKLGLCSSNRERADQVYPSFCKWQGAYDRRVRFGGMSWDMGESLELVTFLNKVRRVFLHGWPVIPLSDGFLHQTSFS